MPEQTQAPQTNPVPAQTPSPTPKKSNAGLIIAIVLIAILLVVCAGGYLTYHYIKGRVSNVVSNVENNTSSNSSSTTASTSSSYDSAKDLTPTGALIITTNNDIKPILEKIYGGVKLQSWTMVTDSYGYAGYIVKRDSNDTDAVAIGTALVAKGYAQQSNTQNETGSIMIFTKGNGSLTIEVGKDNVINITITQDTSSGQ